MAHCRHQAPGRDAAGQEPRRILRAAAMSVMPEVRNGVRPLGDGPPTGVRPLGDRPPSGVRPLGDRPPSGVRPLGGRLPTVGIIGAGPAGLTAAYVLAKEGVPVTVLEADAEYVGGIARTARYKGYHFDIGGHRFFSKSKEVEDLWTEILPNDMLVRPRASRIFYKGKFFAYPLKAVEALFTDRKSTRLNSSHLG